MIFAQPEHIPGFGPWLTRDLGGKWCVAPRLTDRLRRPGYEIAVSQPRYAALHRRFEAQTLARVMFGRLIAA